MKSKMFAKGSCLPLRSARRSATVTISAPLASSASRIFSGEENFPVPRIKREPNSCPAMVNGRFTKGIATQHRSSRAGCRECRSRREGPHVAVARIRDGGTPFPPALTDSAVDHQMPVADDLDAELIQFGLGQLLFYFVRRKCRQQAVVEVPLQNRRLGMRVFPDQSLGPGAAGSEQVGDKDKGSRFRVTSDTSPKHFRIVEVMQEAVRQDQVVALARNRRAGDVTPDEFDPLDQPALRFQGLPGTVQHRGGAVHGVESVAWIGLRKTNS